MSNNNALTILAPMGPVLVGPLVVAAREVLLVREQRLGAERERLHVERIARELRRELGSNGRETTARFIAVVQALKGVDAATRARLLEIIPELLDREDGYRAKRLNR